MPPSTATMKSALLSPAPGCAEGSQGISPEGDKKRRLQIPSAPRFLSVHWSQLMGKVMPGNAGHCPDVRSPSHMATGSSKKTTVGRL